MKFLNPCNDIAFKKIFGSEDHKNVTISFLNSILEFTGQSVIKDVQFLNTEQKRILCDKKDNILDVLCTDQAGNKYIVEVQVEGIGGFGKRIVFYGAKTYALQLGATQAYSKLTPVIAVSVLNFILFPSKKDYKSIHLLLDKKTYEHDLKELSFAFIELPKFTKQESELVSSEDKWIYFLKNISSQNEIPAPLQNKEFKEACEAAERLTWNEEELNAYDDAIVRANDATGMVEFAENAKAKLIAKNLLDLGTMSIDDISQATGLSTQEIDSLKGLKNL